MNFNKLFAQTLTNGGNTVGLNGERVTSGYMVSVSGKYEEKVSLDKFSPGTLAFYMGKYAQILIENPNYFYGFWVDKGEVYMDISENVTDLEDAIYKGINRAQKAIFDVKGGRDIIMPTPQRHGTMSQQASYMKDAIRNLISNN